MTREISAWAIDVLHGPLDLLQATEGPFTLNGKTGTPLLAWINTHPPDPPVGPSVPHRGVTVYEVTGEVGGVTLAPMPAEGCDVSHFQGIVNWGEVASTPPLWWRKKEFAYIKATEGAYNGDVKFADNWAGSRAANIPRGAYHFLHTGIDIPTQAQFFLLTLNKDGANDSGELPPMLDVEPYQSGTRWLTPTADEVREFMGIVQEELARSMLLYIGESLQKTLNLTDITDTCIAHYGVRRPASTAYSFHQYSDTGSVPGIEGHVDLDRFNGGLDDLKLYIEVSAPHFSDPA